MYVFLNHFKNTLLTLFFIFVYSFIFLQQNQNIIKFHDKFNVYLRERGGGGGGSGGGGGGGRRGGGRERGGGGRGGVGVWKYLISIRFVSLH